MAVFSRPQEKLATQTSQAGMLIEDILEQIFVDSLPFYPIDSAVPSTRTAPLNISSVSKHWRQVAVRTPRLWARFDFVKDIGRSADHRANVFEAFRAYRTLELWLKRSHPLPLIFSLEVAYLGYSNPGADHPFLSMLCLLQKHIERWKVARIHAYSVINLPDVDLYLRTGRLLMHLDMHIGIYGPKIEIDLSQSPELKGMNITGHSTFDLSPGTTVFDNLSALGLGNNDEDGFAPNLNIVLDFLRVSPNLEKLVANVVFETPDDPAQEIDLPYLKSMQVVIDDKTTAGALLGPLFLPNLDRFVLRLTNEEDAITPGRLMFHVLDLIYRSGAQITDLALEVHRQAVSSLEFGLCMLACEGLQKLSIRGIAFDDAALEALKLAVRSGSSPLKELKYKP